MTAFPHPPGARPLAPPEGAEHAEPATGTIVIPVYFDFASSLCHVAHRVMGRMAPVLDELDTRLEWIPIDLAALLNWRRGHPISDVRRQHVRHIADGLQVDLTIPTHWLESRPLGARALHRLGVDRARGTCSEATLREFLFTRIFDEGRTCENEAQSLALAREIDFEIDREHELDFDAPALEAGLDALEAWTRHAADQMVTGVPTFMLDRWPFGGIQEDATMESILRRWARKLRAPGADTSGS